MPVEVVWDNAQKTVQVYHFTTMWTWDEMYAAKRKGDSMLDDVEHPVDVIFGGPPDVKLPDNFFPNVINVTRSRHPRARLAIVVMNNAFVRAMFNMLPKLYKREFTTVRFANSLESAREISAEYGLERVNS